jgi:hypothetical protein
VRRDRNEGRKLFMVSSAIEPLCFETALQLYPNDRRGREHGGEDLVGLHHGRGAENHGHFLRKQVRVGTGEFFKQQLARMDMNLEEVNGIPDDSRVLLSRPDARFS